MRRFSSAAVRLPLGWLLLAVLTGIAGRQPTPAASAAPILGSHDVYVVSSPFAGLPMAAAAVIFAGCYLALETSARRYSRRLGLLQLALQGSGSLMILLAPRLIDARQLAQPDYPVEQFRALNWLATGGYLLNLAGLCVFALLLGLAIFPRRCSPPS